MLWKIDQRHAAVTRGLGIALVIADSTIPDLIGLEEENPVAQMKQKLYQIKKILAMLNICRYVIQIFQDGYLK